MSIYNSSIVANALLTVYIILKIININNIHIYIYIYIYIFKETVQIGPKIVLREHCSKPEHAQ